MNKGRVQVPYELAQAFSENGHIEHEAEELATEALQEMRKAWARQEGRRLEREHRLGSEISDLGEVTTAADKLDDDPTPLAWTVDQLHAYGDSTMIVAQNKVGKTTLALNLVRSLLDDEPFLGRFSVDFPEGRICYLNYEVSCDRFVTWIRDLGLKHPHRLLDIHLRGKVFPLDHPAAQDQLARIVEEYEVELLIVDPFQRVFTGENESNNTEVGQFLARLDELKQRAGIPDLLVLDHAGHEEKNRARGASTKGGWADSTWRLTESSGARLFAAFGRDIDLRSTRLEYDDHTRLLTMTEEPGSHREAPSLSLPDHGLLAVIRSDGARGVAEVRKFFEGLEGAKHAQALKAAEDNGYVQRKRDGSAHIFIVTPEGWERHEELRS